MKQGFVVLCDFDGTIAEIDTAVIVFNKFIDGNWKVYNEMLDRGEITLEQCMREQFLMIRTPKSVILEELDIGVPFRHGFEELVNYCNENQIPFEIISAGLGFVINHLLETRGLQGTKVHTVKTMFTENGLEMEAFDPHDEHSIDFKEDLVRHLKDEANYVLYIGDGMSDKGAVLSADYVFVIKGSRLAEFCRTEKLDHKEIHDFYDVISKIKEMRKEN